MISTQGEELGAILFVVAVIIIPALVIQAVQKWRAVSAWVKSVEMDHMPSPHSSRMWADFERTEVDR